MSREIIVSESEKIAVILENGQVREFYLSEGEQNVGDIILATVESIVPAIEAAFLNIGREKSGFIHVSDLPSSRKQQSGIRQFLRPQQQMLVQVTREPTGNKGANLTGFIQLPGRFLVLTPFERRIGLSKRIFDTRERARLARISRIICGSGYGLVLRPEAVGQSEQTLRDDLKLLLGRWKQILAQSEKTTAGTTLYRDQDVLERILREGATSSVAQVTVDSQATYDRAMRYFDNWSDTKARGKVRLYNGQVPILSHFGVYQQLEYAVQPLVQLPSGGTLVIQATEALTSIDINTSSMTSTDNQPETILRTNCEAAEEIAKQLVLRDIGGVIVIDFIDMDNPRDQQIVWQKLADALHHDKSQPQINYFSDFGLVEMTRRRQRQRLSEMLTMPCPTCQGVGRIRNLLYRSDILTSPGMKSRLPVIQPDEKSERYRDGNEKPAPRPTQQRSSSSTGRNSNPRQTEEAAQVSQPKHQVSSAPPAKPIQKEAIAKEKPKEKKEKLEDLLFDDSIFNGELSDSVLESYIEREDSLNVSGRLESALDELIAKVDEQGLESIKRSPSEEAEPKAKTSKSQASESDQDDEYEQAQNEAEPQDNEPEATEESENAEAIVEKPSRKKAPARAKKRPSKTRSKTKESEVDTVEPESDLSPEQEPIAEMVQSEPAISAMAEPETEAPLDAPDEQPKAVKSVSVSPASLAESALTASSKASTTKKPVKRALSKRRTIRSFRPKR